MWVQAWLLDLEDRRAFTISRSHNSRTDSALCWDISHICYRHMRKRKDSVVVFMSTSWIQFLTLRYLTWKVVEMSWFSMSVWPHPQTLPPREKLLMSFNSCQHRNIPWCISELRATLSFNVSSYDHEQFPSSKYRLLCLSSSLSFNACSDSSLHKLGLKKTIIIAILGSEWSKLVLADLLEISLLRFDCCNLPSSSSDDLPHKITEQNIPTTLTWVTVVTNMVLTILSKAELVIQHATDMVHAHSHKFSAIAASFFEFGYLDCNPSTGGTCSDRTFLRSMWSVSWRTTHGEV